MILILSFAILLTHRHDVRLLFLTELSLSTNHPVWQWYDYILVFPQHEDGNVAQNDNMFRQSHNFVQFVLLVQALPFAFLQSIPILNIELVRGE